MITRRLVPALLIALLVSGLFTLLLSRRVAKPGVVIAASNLRYVAASRDLKAGEVLQATALTMTDWPASRPVQGTFLKQDDVAGRILLFPLAAGELIIDHNLVANGGGAGLTAKIPAGMRAISLRSDDVAGVSGFLFPGSYVDVLVTYHASNIPDYVTMTVLQDARVIATGQKTDPDPDGKAATADVVTLLATPQQAEKLTLASSMGKIHFVLRNGADRAEIHDLSPQPSLTTAPKETAHPHAVTTSVRPFIPYTVQTIAGGKHTEESFGRSAQ